MDLNQLYGPASVLVIIALVEAVKRSWEDCPKWAYPGMAIAWGIGFNLVLAYSLQLDYLTSGVLGLLAGLAAAGLYSSSKAAVESVPHG